jgi:ComF family protein
MSGATLKSYLMQAVDVVLPPRCVVTGDIVERQGMIASAAWAGLDFIASPMCDACGRPFEFDVGPGTQCGECIDDRPDYATARAALKYNDTSRDLILGFKHADKTHSVLAFMPWLRRAGAEMIEAADYLVPVPLHRWRFIKRRYNQSAIIAYALSKETMLPCLPDALARTRATPSQGHLKAHERHKNVRRAFALNPKYKKQIVGKTIVLVDDVYTTGATVKECAKVLLNSGAGAVHVLTLARVTRT